MQQFNKCINDIEVEDLTQAGFHFTWNSRPHGRDGIMKKLDRVLGNHSFATLFPRANCYFFPPSLSDHCPTVMYLPQHTTPKARPFKFLNYVVHKGDFKEVV